MGRYIGWYLKKKKRKCTHEPKEPWYSRCECCTKNGGKCISREKYKREKIKGEFSTKETAGIKIEAIGSTIVRSQKAKDLTSQGQAACIIK